MIAPDASYSRQQPSLNLAIVEGCKLHGINNQKLQEFLSSSLSIKISDERNIRRQASKLVQQFMKHSILKYWIIHEVHWKDQVIHESFTRFSKARRPTWHSSGSSSRRQRRISFPGVGATSQSRSPTAAAGSHCQSVSWLSRRASSVSTAAEASIAFTSQGSKQLLSSYFIVRSSGLIVSSPR